MLMQHSRLNSGAGSGGQAGAHGAGSGRPSWMMNLAQRQNRWSNHGLSWSAGDMVPVRLLRPALFALFPLTLFALFSAALPSAMAQENTTLVSNLDQSARTTHLQTYNIDGAQYRPRQAQVFTTGRNFSGYTMTSAQVVSHEGSQSFKVSLCEADSSYLPLDSTCTELRDPATFSSSTLTFTVPTGTTMTLNAASNYALKLELENNYIGRVRFGSTLSTAEDTDSLSHWSVHNFVARFRFTTPTTGYWDYAPSTRTTHYRIAIIGRANPPRLGFVDAELTRSVRENSPAGTNVGAPIPSALDSGNVTYTLEGTDADSFVINSATRRITTKAGVTYDHEAKSSYAVTVRATDGDDNTDTVDVTISVTDVAEPPLAPARPTVAAISGSSAGLNVGWSAPTNTGKPPITGYDVRYCAGSAASCVEDEDFTNGPQNLTATSARILGLMANTTYRVQVRATNDEGDSAWSPSGNDTTNMAAACGPPTLTGGATQVWTGRLAVAKWPSNDYYGFGGGRGSLDDTDFSLIVNPYVIDHLTQRGGNGHLVFSLTSSLSAGEKRTLTLHVCDETQLDLKDASGPTARHDYQWTGTGLDWSAHAERTLYLSWDYTAPTFSGATVDASSLVLTFSENLEPASGLTGGAFTVTADGNPVTVNSVAIDDNKVTLTLSSSVTALQAVTVSYAQPAGANSNKLRDRFDNLVENFSFTGTNNPPTVDNAIPDQRATANRLFRYTVPGDTFSDPEGDPLTYSAKKGDDTALPSWLTFTPGTRLFEGTPGAADAGTLVVRVTANDGTDNGSDTFNIKVAGTDVCFRTPAVRDAIVAAVAGVVDCGDLTSAHLAAITGTLDLSGQSLASLQAGDFDGLTALTTLNLSNNLLSSLPAGIFDALTLLTTLNLDNNTLSALRSGALDSLTGLHRLTLHDNRLASLPERVFRPLRQLATLTLNGNLGAPWKPGGVGAGPDQTVDRGAPITLQAAVAGPWGNNVTYQWTHVNGPCSNTPVSNPLVTSTPVPTHANAFDAPDADTTLHFRLIVIPNPGADRARGRIASEPDWVTVTVGAGSARPTTPCTPNSQTLQTSQASPTSPTSLTLAPVAQAGPDVDVDPESAVTLDGSGSSDPDGERLIFAWSQVSGAEVALAGADRARATFDAPVEPGALSFRLTVTDPMDLSDSDEVTVTVRDQVPDFGDAAVAALALREGQAMEPVVLPRARGGNGALSYSLTSDPAGLAGLSFEPATRTLSGTPSAGGSYVFALRADDADSNTADSDAAVLRFEVEVESILDRAREAVRRALKGTLEGLGTRMLTGTLANIGTRFADGFPGSSLMLGGQSVPLNATGLAGDGVAGAVPHGPCAGIGHDGYGAGGAGEALCGGAASRGIGAEELFRTSAFAVHLGAAPGAAHADPGAARWALWGRGDFGSFAGRPEPGMSYEGELRTGWLGFDGRSGPWVAGVALSHGEGEAEYGFDLGRGVAGSGRLETTVTALYPYGRWTFADGLELRGVLGAGGGEARHVPEGGDEETSGLGMRMASVGVRRALPALAGVDLAVRGDASAVRMETGDGPEFVSNLTADSWRLRAGVEASRRFALGGDDTALVPFVEVAGRRDGGDGVTGTGVEIAGGVRYAGPGVQVEARGRWLAAHTEEGTRERGVSVTARVGPGAHGRGLSLSLSPRWGAGTGAAAALWRDALPHGPGGGADAGAVDARIGYGIVLARMGVVTPFAEAGLAGNESRHLRFGARFDALHMDLGVELAGEPLDSGAAEPGVALRLYYRLSF